MPVVNAIQATFTGGEISPKLAGRVDSDLYKKALKFCENFEPLPYGSIRMRSGTIYHLEPSGLTKDCRIIEFPVYGQQSKSVVLGGGKVRAYDENGQVENGELEFIKNGMFLSGWQNWTPYYVFTVGSSYYLGGGPGAPHEFGNLRQTVPVDPGSYTCSVTFQVARLTQVRVEIGSTLDAHDLADSTFESQDSAHPTQTFDVAVTVPGGTTTVYLKITFTSQIFYSAWETESPGVYAQARIISVSMLDGGGSGPVEFTAPWTDVESHDVQFVTDSSKDRMILVHPKYAPHELTYTQGTEAWTFSAMNFTHPTTPRWASPNFPAAVEIFEGRLWLGGIPGQVNTILASRAGNLTDLTVSSPVVASDAISLDISTKGTILWIQGFRALLIGTDRGEYSAVGSPLSALDFQVKAESAFGSCGMQGLSVGDQVLYISPDRRKVRTISYNLQENGFQSRDLTFAGEHLTKNLIADIAWAQNPNDTLVVATRSGELMACVYNRGEQVAAWWRLNVGGQVYAVMAATGPLGSELRILVQRTNGIFLERLPMYEDSLGALFDSSVVARVSAETAGGLGHLEGETVGVVLDGTTVHPDCVVASGAITLDAGTVASSAQIGLRYRPKVVMLPLEGGGQKGTTQGAKRRRVRLFLRINDSALPLVNGERPFPDRTLSTQLNTPEQRMTGDVMTNMLGFEDGGAITIEQDLPIRTEILAVFGSVEVSEL